MPSSRHLNGRRNGRRDSDSETSSASESGKSPVLHAVRKSPQIAGNSTKDMCVGSATSTATSATSASKSSSCSSVDGQGEINVDLMKDYLRAFKPRNKDITRAMKEDELKELCLRVPCRVDMTRWNPVHDYHEFFKRNGRFNERSKDYNLKLVNKAVNRFKDVMVPKPEYVHAIRTREWAVRKRDHLMLLRLWNHDKQPKRMLIATETAGDKTKLNKSREEQQKD